jgi:hypothetical protein
VAARFAFVGDVASLPARVERLTRKLAQRYGKLHFCHEAGLSGRGLCRQIRGRGDDRSLRHRGPELYGTGQSSAIGSAANGFTSSRITLECIVETPGIITSASISKLENSLRLRATTRS